ncbi:MAG TPA: hypothetical protein VG712_00415 [Gemmatimonadales bacterium]|nr:hypothetical protein [Gemmatimonadales bacterium]
MHRWNLTVAVLFGILAVSPSRHLAAQDCTAGHLPDDSHEAEIFRIRGASTAFGRAISPVTPRQGAVFAMFEVTTLAHIDQGTATPTYCRPGKPAENVNLMSVLPRPRVIFGLADGFTFEASWIPPVTVNDVKANLVSVALGRSVPTARGLISLRAHATLGEIRAPITCTEAQIAVDPLSPGASECAGGAHPSNDHYKPNSFGADMTYGWPVAEGRLRPFLGAGVNFLRPRFQVDFTDQFDVKQDQKVEGDFTRYVAFAGATWIPASRLSFTGEIYADPGTTWVGRLGMAYGVK